MLWRLAALVLFAAAAQAQQPAPEATSLAWRVGKGRFVIYELTHSKADPRLLEAGWIETSWGVSGEELDPTGDQWKPVGITDVSFALALMLPDKKVKPGGSWRIDRKFPSTISHNGYHAKGRGKLVRTTTYRKTPVHELKVTLKITARRSRSQSYPKYSLEQGSFEATLYYSEDRGVISGGALKSSFTFRYPKQKGSKVKIPPQTQSADFAFALDEIVHLADSSLQKRINTAIDLGTKALLKAQAKDGSFGARKTGETALALMALLKSGLASNHEAVSRGFAFLADAPLKQTYEVALALCAVEARYAPSAKKLREMKAEQRAEALGAIRAKLSMVDKDLVKRATTWLLENGKSQKWWYPHKRGNLQGVATIYDNSNSQYAVLGLLAADRCGGAVTPGVWRGVALHWLGDQEPAGPGVKLTMSTPGARYPKKVSARARGWGYQKVVHSSAGTGGYGSMTVGGIGSLAIARDRLQAHGALDEAMRAQLDVGIRDGLAWLERHYAIRHNPRKRGWDYYYYYGLERACAFTGREFIGIHDWYREGAALLVSRQNGAGHWSNAGYHTSMALLFLRRATLPLVLTEAPAK